MPNLRNRFPARRRFLKQSAALSATAGAVGVAPMVFGKQRLQDARRAVVAKTSPPAAPAAAQGTANAAGGQRVRKKEP
jgi:hypothetical protein